MSDDNTKNEPIKFTQDEQNELMEIQRKFQKHFQDFGRLYVERMEVEDRLTSLSENEKVVRDDFRNSEQTERDFVDKITKKYGKGEYNTQTGDYVPLN
jgi:hypothetical protein